MSQDVRTRPADPGDRESVDGLDGGTDGTGVDTSDLLNRLWRFFISMRTGLILILILGLLSLLGAALVQAPQGMTSGSAGYADFVTSVKPKYGGWTVILDKLGLFSVFTSIWFKAITVLLVTSVLACSVNRAPRLWKLAFHPRTQMSETFFTHAPLRAAILVDAAPDKALEDVHGVLRSHHFRTVADPDDQGLNMYADRFRWGPFGTVMAHVSFVIITLGFFLSANAGFKDPGFTAPVGQKVEVGHGTGLSVVAKSFTDAYYADGAPKDYVSDLILYKDGAQVDRKMVRVNQPMSWDGVSFYQSSFGVAASMKVTDTAGKTLYGQSVPLAWTSEDGAHAYGSFEMPSKGLTVYVVSAASGKPDPQIKAGQVQLEIHQADKKDPIATEVVSQGKPVTIDGVTYTFERTRQYTQLIVARDPGANFVWLGSVLLVLGLFLVFFFPHRRFWVRIRKTPTGSEILCASTMKRDVAFKPQFNQLVTDIQLAGTPSSTIQKVGQNDA
jgi:cytochrome c biogenesis protein